MVEKEKRILVPVDFSNVTETVTKTAIKLSGHTGNPITLLYVKHIKSDPGLDKRLEQLAVSISQSGIQCDRVIREGSIFREVSAEAANGRYALALIGSHGFKGLREVMFGADILRLLKLIPVPAMTVLKEYTFPEEGIRKILFPVASHPSFHLILDAVLKFSQIFAPEVHLYSVEKPEIKWTDRLTSNIQRAETALKNASVNYLRVNEPQSDFSIGYSKQILNYAARIKADLIALMSVPAKEHFYFADGDKEQIITNKYAIPVISTSDRI